MYSLSERAISVSKVTAYIRSILDEDVILSEVAVSGELSDVKYHSSGHVYFTLKDAKSSLSAVMFRQDAEILPFTLKDGAAVVCTGRVSVYEKNGRYQLYSEYIEQAGDGAGALAFALLKEKLSKEGLFDVSRKRPIPKKVTSVAAITSPTGAVLRDIVNVIRRRSPKTAVTLVPSAVQGDGAAREVVSAIAAANAWGRADLIILGRGGGSGDDLSAFNDEALVRAVGASKIPIISAVGHETDYTLCDFAADLRAPTPSAAAELAVQDERVVIREFLSLVGAIDGLARERLDGAQTTLRRGAAELENNVNKITSRRRQALGHAAALIEAQSPMKILAKGYAAVEKGGETVKAANALVSGDRIKLTFADGGAFAEVI